MGMLWLGMEAERAVTLSFLTLGCAQLWHVFTMRNPRSGIVVNDITQNRWIWGALFLCIGLLLMTVYVPTLASMLAVHAPGLHGWLTILGMSLVPALIGQALHLRVRRRGSRPVHAGPDHAGPTVDR